jgi:hypothetical protein
MPGDEPIHRPWQSTAHDAVADGRPVALHQSPACAALVLRNLIEENRRRRIVEGQDRETLLVIDSDGDTRRPSAEASAGVVQQHWSARPHLALSKPSSVARTSGPIVSST